MGDFPDSATGSRSSLPYSAYELVIVRQEVSDIRARVVAGAAALLVAVAACTTPSPITFEELIGTWGVLIELDPSEPFVGGLLLGSVGQKATVQFNEDGTYRFPQWGYVDRRVLDQGQFTLEGTLLTFISNEDSRMCAAGQRGSYRVKNFQADRDRPRSSGAGVVPMIQLEDECDARRSSFEDVVELQRFVNFELPFDPEPPGTLPDPDDIEVDPTITLSTAEEAWCLDKAFSSWSSWRSAYVTLIEAGAYGPEAVEQAHEQLLREDPARWKTVCRESFALFGAEG